MGARIRRSNHHAPAIPNPIKTAPTTRSNPSRRQSGPLTSAMGIEVATVQPETPER